MMLANIVKFTIIVSLVAAQDNLIKCPRGWIEEREICYKFTRTPTKNRQDAFAKCRDYSAELVSVNGIVEHNFVVDWLRKHDPQHRRWYTSASNKGDAWFWDGDGAQFINIDGLWLPNNEKVGYQYEDAAYTYSKDAGRWGLLGLDGYENLPYICEIPKHKLDQIIIDDRSLDYGLIVEDPEKIPRSPKFIKEPEDAIFDTSARGQVNNVKLRCVADGYPYPEYKWFKEEYEKDRIVSRIIEPLNDARFTQTDGTLNVNKPEPSDRGKYHCIARNKFGTVISRTVLLSFGFVGEFSKARSAETGREYWGKALYCDPPNFRPAIQYNWVRQEFPYFVQEDERLFVSQDGNLYFTALEKSDEATYSCNVQSVISSTGRTGPLFQLTVTSFSSSQDLQFPNNFPKAFPENPFAGQDVRLECVAFGYPIPSYNWTRKGHNKQLPSTARVTNHNRVLILPKVSIEDTGEYECTALNNKAIQNSVTLDILAHPVFTIPLEDKLLDAGSELRWLCEAFGIPEVKYKWLKNGQELVVRNLPVQDRDRYKIDENLLLIQYLDPVRDPGVYQCKAYNFRNASFSAGELRVLTLKPSFDKYPMDKEMYAQERGNITIPCRPEAAPKPEFVWRRNGIVIGNSGNIRILNNGYLVINSVQFGDQGKYSCLAKNEYGEDETEGYLVVLREPIIRTRSDLLISSNVNDSIELQCSAHISDTLDLAYVWLRNNLPINVGKEWNFEVGHYPGYLRIHNLSLSDSGSYRCVVKTPIGSTSYATKIFMLGPPGAPGGITASDPTHDSIKIRWMNGALNGDTAFGYTIEGETNHKKGWVTIVHNVTYGIRELSNGRKEYYVNGLLSPWSVYKFRISAVNKYGMGPPSLPSPKYNTFTFRPLKYPSKIGGGGGKIGDLTIKWQPLEPQDWNAEGIGYVIYWKDESSSEPFMKQDIRRYGNIGLYVIRVGQVNYYRPYLIKLQAHNVKGAGPISPEFTVFSAENIPNVVVDQVKVMAYNSTSLNVSWTPIKDSRDKIRGTLVGHRIKYWLGSDPSIITQPEKGRSLLIRGNKAWGLIVGLIPDTMYTVTVSVYNNAGSGKMSESSFERTFKKAPVKAPTSVDVKPLSPASVLVTWRYVSPTSDEEPIQGYKVRYWEFGEDLTAARNIYKYRDDGPLEAIVTDLVPGKVYNLRVLAFSQGGDGTMSSPSYEFKTEISSATNVISSFVLMSSSLFVSLLLVKLFHRNVD